MGVIKELVNLFMLVIYQNFLQDLIIDIKHSTFGIRLDSLIITDVIQISPKYP